MADVPVNIDSMLDTSLARLSVETDRRVEMLLGHSALLNFMTGVDYGKATLTLARYTDPGPLETEMFQNFGIWLADAVGEGVESCFPITALVHGSEAELAGLGIGDCVMAIDGRPVAEMSTYEGELTLQRAEIGDTKLFTLRTGVGENESRTVALVKHDRLPSG